MHMHHTGGKGMQECGWEGQSERANRWFEAEAASARVLLLRQGIAPERRVSERGEQGGWSMHAYCTCALNSCDDASVSACVCASAAAYLGECAACSSGGGRERGARASGGGSGAGALDTAISSSAECGVYLNHKKNVSAVACPGGEWGSVSSVRV